MGAGAAAGRRGGRGVERLDRRHDLAPMADHRDAEVLEILDRQLRQHVAVDLVVAERRLVLPEAEAPQPTADIHPVSLRPPAPMMVLRCGRVHNVYREGRNKDQLRETTLDRDAACSLQVKIREVDEADDMFVKLMGDVVEPRREFIQDNALTVANLDV
jgi:hypothetical protein